METLRSVEKNSASPEKDYTDADRQRDYANRQWKFGDIAVFLASVSNIVNDNEKPQNNFPQELAEDLGPIALIAAPEIVQVVAATEVIFGDDPKNSKYPKNQNRSLK